MAKWTLSEFIKKLRAKIDEPGTDYFSDDELTTYLNMGVKDMAQELELECYNSISITNTKIVNFYDVFFNPIDLNKTPSARTHNFLQMTALFINGTLLPLGTLGDSVRGKDCYYLWNKQIHFTTEKTGTLEVYYVKLPSDMVSLTDTCDIPEIYQHILLDFAAAECKEKDADPQADQFRSKYEGKKQEMKQELHDKEYDMEQVISITDYGHTWGDE